MDPTGHLLDMGDTKEGRERKQRNEDDAQRERELDEELEREEAAEKRREERDEEELARDE
jgi:hypothetical protein